MSDKSVLVAPSILSADFSDIAAAVRKLESAGADLVHCDVMDGHFVPNLTFGAKFVKDLRKHTNLPLDVHLMITHPDKYVDDFIAAGADYITFHVESDCDVAATLERIKEAGVRCGVVVSPDTPVSALEKFILQADMLLLMSVYPGFGGQKFIERSYERLDELVRLSASYPGDRLIEIDGGVNLANAAEIRRHGANVLVAGNAVFTANNMKAAIAQIRSGN